MTIEHTLDGELRDKTGTAECRRLRKAGLVPGNIHGHGKDSIAIKVPQSGLTTLVATGTRLFDLKFGSETETVMFRQVQWDAFGIEMQHVDFLRVDATERVTVEIPVQIRGTSPGMLAGGQLEQPMRRLEVECLAAAIPDSIQVKIGALKIGDAIHISDLTMDPGVTATQSPETLVCQVVAPKLDEDDEDDEDGEGDAGPAEPEVIGKSDDGDAADS